MLAVINREPRMTLVFAICEMFGGGDFSVASKVCELLNRLDLARSYTTRQKRNADDNGFIFTTQQDFMRMIAGEQFLENVQALGIHYGTPHRCLQEARDKGDDLVIKVDERGAAQ